MNLAFVLFRYFPHGGLERDFLKIALECQKRGHRITVYTMSWQGDIPQEFNIEIITTRGITNHQRANSFAKRFEKNKTAHEAHDLIIGFNKMPGLDIYFAADACYAAQPHTWFKKLTKRYRVYKKLEAAVFNPKTKTHILLLTEKQQKDFTHCYHTPKERLHVLSPSCNIITGERKKHEHYSLLMVASYFKTKGLDRALYAIAALPKALKNKTVLTVVGGDDQTYFKNLAQKLNIAPHVKFVGAQDNVLPFYLNADLLIHPAYKEAAGKVLIEAMSAGLPILTTDICGYSDHVKNARAGIIIDSPFVQKNLNTALVELLHNNEGYSARAIDYAKKYFTHPIEQAAADFIENRT